MAKTLKQTQVEVEVVEATMESSDVSESPAMGEKSTNILGSGPIYKDRSGRIQMAIWAREDRQQRLRYTITLKRSYKVNDGYKETNSLDQRDLTDAIHLLSQAQEFLPKQSASVEDNDGA